MRVTQVTRVEVEEWVAAGTAGLALPRAYSPEAHPALARANLVMDLVLEPK